MNPPVTRCPLTLPSPPVGEEGGRRPGEGFRGSMREVLQRGNHSPSNGKRFLRNQDSRAELLKRGLVLGASQRRFSAAFNAPNRSLGFRLMESHLSLSRMHWDHEPHRAPASWSAVGEGRGHTPLWLEPAP